MDSQANSAKIIVVFSVLVALALSSCAFQRGATIKTQEDVRKGTEALSMDFLENSPPLKIFSAEDDFPESGLFQTSIKLSNVGAADINSGRLTLSLEEGYVNDIMRFWESSNPELSRRYEGNFVTFSLKGKTPQNPAGDTILFSKVLQAKIPLQDAQTQSRKSTIIATACYDYKTEKTATICLDPKPFTEKVGLQPCTPAELTFDSQGAPVAITKISPRMIVKGQAATVELLIYVKNKGKGQVTPSNKIAAACEPTGGEKDFWNTINKEDFKISLSSGQEDFNCGPFPLRIGNGDEDFIRCIYDGIITGNTPYKTTLNLELDYGYTESISKEVTIERPPRIS